MSTKFSALLQDKKIDPRRVISASEELEKLRPEDRALKLAKRTAKVKAAAGDEKAKAFDHSQKPRSGRPVTPRALDAAMTGKAAISGPQKTRLLRAVNALLALKKLPAVELKTLF